MSNSWNQRLQRPNRSTFNHQNYRFKKLLLKTVYLLIWLLQCALPTIILAIKRLNYGNIHGNNGYLWIMSHFLRCAWGFRGLEPNKCVLVCVGQKWWFLWFCVFFKCVEVTQEVAVDVWIIISSYTFILKVY